MKRFCFSLIFILSSLSILGSIDDYFPSQPIPSSSNVGETGLMVMPNARFMEEGVLKIGISASYPQEFTSIVASPFSWMEATYRYTEIENLLYGPANYSGNQSYKDKGFDINKLEKLLDLSTLNGDIDKVFSDDRVKNLNKIGKLNDVIDSLKARGVKNTRINMSVVRGLDYYSKTVFEIQTNTLGSQNALCGGGRYDYLVEDLGGESTPAIGFAAGVERTIANMKREKIRVPSKDELHVFVAQLGREAKKKSLPLIEELREAGVKTMGALGKGSINIQLKIADKFSFNSDNIIPIMTGELSQIANRPLRSTLDSRKISKILKINHPEMDYIINIFKDRINE